MSNRNKGLFFPMVGGNAKLETPDGVTIGYSDGHAPNSLTNSGFAIGGPDGGGYGAFTKYSNDGTGTSSVIFCGDSGSKTKIRVD